jgi:hypothetical protein
MLHQQLMADAGKEFEIFNLLLFAEVEKFLQYVRPLFISRRREMVSSEQRFLFIPDLSLETIKIVNKKCGGGIVAENKIEIKFRVVIFGNRPVVGPMLKKNVVRVGILALHVKVKPQAH